MAITDPRSKWVLHKIIDQASTSFPLSTIFTDLGSAMQKGESVDIPTRGSVSITAASAGSVPNTMTVQSNLAVANRLTTDQHYGAIVQVPKLNAIHDLEGTWSTEEANAILTELQDHVDTAHWDDAVQVAAYTAGTTATYWVNAAGEALGLSHISMTQAKMMSQRGARKDDLVWVFNPYGIESVRALPSWQINAGVDATSLGMKSLGLLNGIPVVESQSVRDQTVLAVTASVIENTFSTQTLTVPAGHGIVPGMEVTTTGFSKSDHNQDSDAKAQCSTTTATTIVIANESAPTSGNLVDTTGTATISVAMNGLINKRWAFSRVQQSPSIRIVPEVNKFSDQMQCDVLYGIKTLAGAVIGLGSPRQSI